MSMLRNENWDSTKVSHASGKYIDAVADAGEGPGGLAPPPLILDENDARRAEKGFFELPGPWSQDLDDAPPPLPLYEGRIRYWDVQDSGKNVPTTPIRGFFMEISLTLHCVWLKFRINGF